MPAWLAGQWPARLESLTHTKEQGMEESQFTEAKSNLAYILSMDLIDAGQMYEAWESWNNEVGYFLNKMDCGHYYNIAICDFDRAEDNYEEFCNMGQPGRLFTWAICPSPTQATSTSS